MAMKDDEKHFTFVFTERQTEDLESALFGVTGGIMPGQTGRLLDLRDLFTEALTEGNKP